MAELLVVGPEPLQRWCRPLPEDKVVRLGRAPRNGWAVWWDGLISREHAELEMRSGQLHVRRLDTARNPIYYEEVDQLEFLLSNGETFRIGQTTFHLQTVEFETESRSPLDEQSFAPSALKSFDFRNADHRLGVLAKLPKLIARSKSDEDLAQEIVQLLLDAIPHADAAAVVQYADVARPQDSPKMMRWNCRGDGEGIGRFRPSRRLIFAALQSNQGKLHIWQDGGEAEPQYTISGNLDWAFCTPVEQQACKGWALYVSGQIMSVHGSQSLLLDDVSIDDLLKGDLRFTQLLADFIGSIRQVRMLEKEQSFLYQFLSPATIEVVREFEDSSEILRPKESDITVLFCDVRGFSQKTETAAEQDLRELLDRVSDALGVMTCGIIRFDGVIADFQGDAALGFWGWPKDQPDGPILACRAALLIHDEFRRARSQPNHSLADFKVGIGIAHGRAIAGKIGTAEQIKVGAFGPVVNLGARLEGMTKELRAPILIDEATADYVRKHLPSQEGRVRRLGHVRPAGMRTALMVSELLPPVGPETISDQTIIDHEAAVDAVIDGKWSEALELLGKLPVRDRTKDFLMIFIATNQYEPPEDWNGVIEMYSK